MECQTLLLSYRFVILSSLVVLPRFHEQDLSRSHVALSYS